MSQCATCPVPSDALDSLGEIIEVGAAVAPVVWCNQYTSSFTPVVCRVIATSHHCWSCKVHVLCLHYLMFIPPCRETWLDRIALYRTWKPPEIRWSRYIMNECFSSKRYSLPTSFSPCSLLPPSFPPKAARSQTNSLGSSIKILDKQAFVAISLSSTQTKDIALTFQKFFLSVSLLSN